MRTPSRLPHLFSLCLTASLLVCPDAGAEERPNFVFIIADDCTYLDMEVYGGQAKTPHLQALAEEGMRFTRCFQAAPMCSPTRHNLYTGIYPVKSGAWPNHTAVYEGTPSIAHHLQEAGYRVALSGKTHIRPKSSFPFEYSDDFRKADPTRKNPYPAIDTFLAECRETDTPFCLFACSNEPHTPYTKGDPSAYPPESLHLPPSWVDTPETRACYSQYLAEISYYDQQCGALLTMLDRHDLKDNTLVIVVSEQGSAFPFAKWTCFELGLASGMIARWPGKIAKGTLSDALVEYVDVVPTFLQAAQVPLPPILEGRSFLPVLLGHATEHKQYTFGIHTTRGIINGSTAFGVRSCGTKRYRYIRNLHPETTFTNAVTRAGGDKADFWSSWLEKAQAGDTHAQAMTAKYQSRPPEELYDVENDPHCLANLIDTPALQDVRRELASALDAWMETQGDQGAETEASAHTRQPGRKRRAIPNP